jgi:hypothetical protein
MPDSTWVTPQFRELNLSSEIGSYFEEEEIPSFLQPRETQASAEAAPAEQVQAVATYAVPGRHAAAGVDSGRVGACE